MLKDYVTVVIPCKNEEEYIQKTLLSLNEQKFIDNVEVMIADANSTDNTLQKIEEISKQLKFKLSIIEGGTVSYGRNKGASMTNTKYILFLDADTTIIDKDTILDSLIELEFGYDLVTCKIKCRNGDIRAKLGFYLFNIINYLLPVSFSPGVYFMTNKKCFDSLGGFDESIKHSEDFILSKKYPKKRFKIMNKRVTQDDRRFKKMGYIKFLKMLFINYINKNNEEHFKKDINYFK